jgi:hypothetical protein
MAQLHWPRLYLASDGCGRLEINYARIVGRAYATFNPIPSETELYAWIQEYSKNYLLYLYKVDGQLWGQWDTRKELLPRYKTAADRRSPKPPEAPLLEWKQQYRLQNNGFPKCFENISETFLHGVGVGVGEGVGKNICASPKNGDARESDFPPIQEPSTLFPVETKNTAPKPTTAVVLTPEQESWFAAWWTEYPRHRGKKAARAAFSKQVRSGARFQQVMAATRAQKAEMLAKEPQYRPHGATWLNGERWEDEASELAPRAPIWQGPSRRLMA